MKKKRSAICGINTTIPPIPGIIPWQIKLLKTDSGKFHKDKIFIYSQGSHIYAIPKSIIGNGKFELTIYSLNGKIVKAYSNND